MPNRLCSLVGSLCRDRSGATAIEYALIAGGIALVIIAAVALLGSSLSDFFGTLATELSG